MGPFGLGKGLERHHLQGPILLPARLSQASKGCDRCRIFLDQQRQNMTPNPISQKSVTIIGRIKEWAQPMFGAIGRRLLTGKGEQWPNEPASFPPHAP
jgi:hypothetical protein